MILTQRSSAGTALPLVFPDLSISAAPPPRFVDYSVLLAFSVRVASLIGSSQQHSHPLVLDRTGLAEVSSKNGTTSSPFCALNLCSVITVVANVQFPTRHSLRHRTDSGTICPNTACLGLGSCSSIRAWFQQVVIDTLGPY